MYLVINMKKYMFSIVTLLLLLTSLSIYANELKIEINLAETPRNVVNDKNIGLTGPLDGITVSYNKIVKYQDNLKTKIQIEDFQRSPSSPTKRGRTLFLKPNQFIEIMGVDSREKLFDGSIIIEFAQLPDLERFADTNEVLFVSDLSDINRGVFKVLDLYELEEKLSKLKLDSNILSIELDTIDPSITNQ
jgi:hypothetical protein|tara:strand:+ start:409 stop:978 length:570 start_codon:yes stop_codon:yes gene_type:complete